MSIRPGTSLAVAAILLGLSSGAHAQQETLGVEGLVAPVEIVTDRWGIAHIYAENEHDLFFAQGYNAVRDRLFQFEVWRRQATGTVAEILGPRELPREHRRPTAQVSWRYDDGDGAAITTGATRSFRRSSTASTRISI